MGKKSATKNQKSGNAYKDFKYDGKKFSYTGRVYEKKDGKGKVVSNSYVTLTLNGSITIHGIWFVELSESYFLKFPQYKMGDEWKSYVFLDDAFKEEISELEDVSAKIQGIE